MGKNDARLTRRISELRYYLKFILNSTYHGNPCVVFIYGGWPCAGDRDHLTNPRDTRGT